MKRHEKRFWNAVREEYAAAEDHPYRCPDCGEVRFRGDETHACEREAAEWLASVKAASAGDEQHCDTPMQFVGARGVPRDAIVPRRYGTRVEVWRCLSCGELTTKAWAPTWIAAVERRIEKLREEIIRDEGGMEARSS